MRNWNFCEAGEQVNVRLRKCWNGGESKSLAMRRRYLKVREEGAEIQMQQSDRIIY